MLFRACYFYWERLQAQILTWMSGWWRVVQTYPGLQFIHTITKFSASQREISTENLNLCLKSDLGRGYIFIWNMYVPSWQASSSFKYFLLHNEDFLLMKNSQKSWGLTIKELSFYTFSKAVSERSFGWFLHSWGNICYLIPAALLVPGTLRCSQFLL